MKYYSISYAVNDGLPEVTREDVQKLTHMNLAFGLISENGLLEPRSARGAFRRWLGRRRLLQPFPYR